MIHAKGRELFMMAVLMALVLAGAPGVAHADLFSSGVNLGAAGRTQQWTIFSLGNTAGDTDIFDKNAEILGDVGVAGAGNLTMDGNSLLNGNLSYHTGGKLTLLKNSKITGSKLQNAQTDTTLNQGVIDANNASNAAFAMPVSAGYPSTLRLTKSDLTLSGSGRVVLKLTDFVLSNKSTLTLQGTATTTFIINVANIFSLSKSDVILSGGLLASNVLFNVRGGGTASLSDKSELNGIILATNRTIEVSGSSSVLGELIGKTVSVTDKGKVKRPPVVSH